MPHPLASLRRHPVRVGICLSMSIRLCSLTRPRGVNYTEKKKVKSKEMKSKEEELGQKNKKTSWKKKERKFCTLLTFFKFRINFSVAVVSITLKYVTHSVHRISGWGE